jgi:hypothetical protein
MMTRLWFNRTFSSLHPVLRQLKSTSPGREWHITVSHTQPSAAVFADADASATEPAHLKGRDYVDWCLDFCREREISVFFPGRAVADIADAREEFSALGTALSVAADGPTLRLLEEKADFLPLVPESTALVPRFISVTNSDEFQKAVEEITVAGFQACFKPSVAINGLGFYALEDATTPVTRLLESIPYKISFAEAKQILATQETFPQMLVMEYLEGVEYSVDCLAHLGQLLATVVRRKALKAGAPQDLISHPALEQSVRLLTAQFGLTGLFNVQFRETNGVPKLLEINGRASGGMMFSCAAGMPFVEMAVACALHPAGPIPEPPRIAWPKQVHSGITPMIVSPPPPRIYDICGGRFEIELDHEDEPFDELCRFALRNNARRRFLFVSRVLGRHLPTRPAALRRVAMKLAEKLQTGLPAGPCIFFGMAETATTLGQAVFSAWVSLGGNGLYIDGTRRRTGGPVAFSFSEDHSHATAHLIHQPDAATDPQNLFGTAVNVVIVDDEATTGRTAANLTNAYARWRGQPLESFHRSLAVLLRWQPADPSPAGFNQIISLAGGKFKFSATSKLPADTPVSATADPATFAPRGSRHGTAFPQNSNWPVPERSLEKVLVIGNGEFGYIPLHYAERLEEAGHRVWVQATTRSPILLGGAIGHIRSFPALTGADHTEYLYNVPDEHPYDRVILCLEDAPPPPDHPILHVPKLEILTTYD